MTITLAGRLVQDGTNVSPQCRLTLSFVDGGLQWLEWALTSPSARYDFSDETTLVSAVQQGLHASPLALLPHLALMVSPVKLMTLSQADLRTLRKAEDGDPNQVVTAQLTQMLSAHQLRTLGDLTAGSALLAQWGVAGAPVFQVMNLQDREMVYELLQCVPDDSETTGDLASEAAQFAVQQARTPCEFVDYYKVYLGLAAKQPVASTPDQRSALAQQAMTTLLPSLFQALDCPSVQDLPSPQQVAEVVKNWLTSGKRLGFARLSLGLQQIVESSPYKGETGDAALKIARTYLDSAQAFLAANRPYKARMGQDGATCLFYLQSGDQIGELELSSTGTISLRRYGSAAHAAPEAAP